MEGRGTVSSTMAEGIAAVISPATVDRPLSPAAAVTGAVSTTPPGSASAGCVVFVTAPPAAVFTRLSPSSRPCVSLRSRPVIQSGIGGMAI